MQWQPRTALARLYLSSGVTKAVLNDIFGELQKRPEDEDDETRALVSQLNYAGEPITFATLPDSAGAVYELRVPQRLIVALPARLAPGEKRSRIPRNEVMVRSFIEAFGKAEKAYRTEHGRFGSLDELKQSFPYDKSLFDGFGYKFDFSISDGKFEATATPVEYGKTGRQSFFVDENSGLCEADHEGRPATAADKEAPKRPA